jgi:hypothetical protein
MVIEGLKAKGVKIDRAYPRESRKMSENSIRTAEGVIELRRVVQSLEEVVHSTQEVDDIADEQRIKEEKEKYRETMRNDGWLFSDDPHKLVGQRCRRYFRSVKTPSDGTIVAYLSADLSEDNTEVFYIEHDDGDQEDVNVLTATKAAKYFLLNSKECDEEDIIGDAIDNEDVESVEFDDENAFEDGEDEDDSDDEEGDEDDDDETGMRLWPSRNVRMKWLSHLQSSQTVSELALALAAFTDHVNYRILKYILQHFSNYKYCR